LNFETFIGTVGIPLRPIGRAGPSRCGVQCKT